MNDIFIAGVSMTHFGKHLVRSMKDLTGEALNAALKARVQANQQK